MKNRTFDIRDNDILFDMMRMYQNLATDYKGLHDEMTRDYDMVVSKLQWRDEWKAAMERKGRSANSYNLLTPAVDAIMGVFVGDLKQLIAKPTGTGDAKTAEIITQVLLHFFHQTKFDRARIRTAIDSIIAKYGMYYVGWSYENNPLGELIVEAIDPRTVYSESNFNDPQWRKSGYVFRKHELSIEEILNKFALDDQEMQNALLTEANVFFEQDTDKRNKWVSKKLKNLFTAVYEVAFGASSYSGSRALDQRYFEWFNPRTGKFSVLEMHEKRTEQRLVINDNTRQKMIDITEQVRPDDRNKFGFDNEKIGIIKERYGIIGEPRTELADKRFFTAVVPAFMIKVNEQPYPYQLRNFCYIPSYYSDLHADPIHAQSLIDSLADPQMEYNKARSVKLELLTRYINRGYVAEENAIAGLEQYWTTDELVPIRLVRDGYANRIKPEEQLTVSPDLIRELGELPVLMDRMSKVGDPMKGIQETGEKSAKHFNAKLHQQTQSHSLFFSNHNESAIVVGDTAIRIIQSMVTVPRVFRILENSPQTQEVEVNQQVHGIDPETGQLVMKVINDITVGEYDVQTAKTPYSANAREIAKIQLADIFNAALEVDPKKADAMLPIMVKAGDYPYADEILEAWQPKQNPEQTQLQQAMIKIQMIMAKLGIEEKKVEIAGKVVDNEVKKQELKRITRENVLGMSDRGNGKAKSKELNYN